MSVERTLAGALSAAGVEASWLDRLAAYGALLLEANARLNLTAARTPEALAEHIVDALTLAGDVRSPLIDIGSGNGLPGIPLAIATGARVVLVDSVAKKAAALGGFLNALGIVGEALPARAEELARDPAYREQFATATARAVASAPSASELTVPFLAVGGRALLQRGTLPEEELRAVTDAAPMLGSALVEQRIISDGRRLLVVEKRSATPTRFPRRNGVPVKRPLCLDQR